MKLLKKIIKHGKVTESSAPQPEGEISENAENIKKVLKGSLQLRHVDAGSCNGCEIEIGTTFSPIYDGERSGARLVASPRHADGLLVTGPVTENMATALERTLEATPDPKVVIALGDCAMNCGEFKGGYAVRGSVSDVVDVDIEIKGCPPEPTAILGALNRLCDK